MNIPQSLRMKFTADKLLAKQERLRFKTKIYQLLIKMEVGTSSKLQILDKSVPN